VEEGFKDVTGGWICTGHRRQGHPLNGAPQRVDHPLRISTPESCAHQYHEENHRCATGAEFKRIIWIQGGEKLLQRHLVRIVINDLCDWVFRCRNPHVMGSHIVPHHDTRKILDRLHCGAGIEEYLAVLIEIQRGVVFRLFAWLIVFFLLLPPPA
jgi:hypothetical protein